MSQSMCRLQAVSGELTSASRSSSRRPSAHATCMSSGSTMFLPVPRADDTTGGDRSLGRKCHQSHFLSALQVKVCAVDHYRRLANASSDDARAPLWDSSGIPAIGERLRGDFIGLVGDISKFLSRAVGIDDLDPTRSRYSPNAKDWYAGLLRKQTGDTLRLMRGETWISSGFRTFFESNDRPMPMTSLRDVDEPGIIQASEPVYVLHGRRLHKLGVGALMRMLRRGDGRWGDEESDDDDTEGAAT